MTARITAALVVALAAARATLIPVQIEGSSMSPTIEPGTWCLFMRWLRPRQGDIVLVKDALIVEGVPHLLVKRITRFNDDGLVWLEGDNTEDSTDSRAFGALPTTMISGRYITALRHAAASRPGGAAP